MNTNRIAVVGGGSWATAIVKILSNNCDRLSWWLRSEESVAFINAHHHNPVYLSDVVIDTGKVTVTSSIQQAVADASVIILAVPSAFLKQVLQDADPEWFRGKIIFSAIKGIVPETSLIVGEHFHVDDFLVERLVG